MGMITESIKREQRLLKPTPIKWHRLVSMTRINIAMLSAGLAVVGWRTLPPPPSPPAYRDFSPLPPSRLAQKADRLKTDGFGNYIPLRTIVFLPPAQPIPFAEMLTREGTLHVPLPPPLPRTRPRVYVVFPT